jgi:hypothetical protein
MECKYGDHYVTIDTDEPNYDPANAGLIVVTEFMQHMRDNPHHRFIRPDYDHNRLMEVPSELVVTQAILNTLNRK